MFDCLVGDCILTLLWGFGHGFDYLSLGLVAYDSLISFVTDWGFTILLYFGLTLFCSLYLLGIYLLSLFWVIWVLRFGISFAWAICVHSRGCSFSILVVFWVS